MKLKVGIYKKGNDGEVETLEYKRKEMKRKR